MGQFSEYYFDCSVDCDLEQSDFGREYFRSDGREELFSAWKKSWQEERKPQIYIMNDYDRGPMTYGLYLFLPHWCAFEERKSLGEKRDIGEVLEFEHWEELGCEKEYAHVIFDRDGVDYRTHVDVETREESLPENDGRFNEIEFNKLYRFSKTVADGKEDASTAYSDEWRRIKLYTPKNDRDCDFSGTGRVEIYMRGKDGRDLYRIVYFFCVNFNFRKPILYDLTEQGGKIRILFEKINEPVSFSVRIIERGEISPVLENDAGCNVRESRTVTLQKARRQTVLTDVVAQNGCQYLLDFANEDDSKIYMLLRKLTKEARRLCKSEKSAAGQKGFQFCPFCHKKIEFNAEMRRRYHNCGVSCQGNAERELYEDVNGEAPGLLSYKEEGKSHAVKPSDGYMYCETDSADDRRTLPNGYMDQDNFKIVMYGSPRAGKSSYLAKLFDIRKDDDSGQRTFRTKMSGSFIANTLQRSNLKLSMDDIRSLKPIELLEADKKNKEDKKDRYVVEGAEFPWKDSADQAAKTAASYSKYVDRSFDGNLYLDATQKQETQKLVKCPFMFRTDGTRGPFVSFYDISGESAAGRETRADVELMSTLLSGRLGIFLVINGTAEPGVRDPDGSVFDVFETTIRSAGVQYPDIYNIPVAVIVTKFDSLEEQFRRNAHCLRGDVGRMFHGRYEGSLLEENVEMSSEEIRAFLACKRNIPFGHLFALPGDEDRGNGEEKMKHVRFFGVSTIQAREAIHHISTQQLRERLNAPEGADNSAYPEYNYTRFRAAPKRLEVPLIWMFYQFGIIQ